MPVAQYPSQMMGQVILYTCLEGRESVEMRTTVLEYLVSLCVLCEPVKFAPVF